MPELQHLVICEEKYMFTPDTFKAHTRKQRSSKQVKNQTIHHLKSGREILSSERFNKEACITSREGKTLISTYVAENIDKMVIRKDLLLDIDSELLIKDCKCLLSQSNVNACLNMLYHFDAS